MSDHRTHDYTRDGTAYVVTERDGIESGIPCPDCLCPYCESPLLDDYRKLYDGSPVCGVCWDSWQAVAS